MCKRKTCSCCKKIRLIKFFGKDNHKKDGLHYYCKTCVKLKDKIWRKNHPEYDKKYYAENKEQLKEKSRNYIVKIYKG